MEERGGMSVNQVVLHGIVHQLGVGFQIHLFQHTRPVGADGLDAEGEFRGNLCDRLAGRYQAQHLELPVGQGLVGQLLESVPISKASFSARNELTYLPPLTTLRMALTNSSGALSFVR